jgi:hypothetical protein
MVDREDSWVESYYDTLSFFYWEPQHIGRKKYVDPRLKSALEVQNHVRTMEVTLNHQIKQFLCLAPDSFRGDARKVTPVPYDAGLLRIPPESPQLTPLDFSPRARCMMSSQTWAAARSFPRIAWL